MLTRDGACPTPSAPLSSGQQAAAATVASHAWQDRYTKVKLTEFLAGGRAYRTAGGGIFIPPGRLSEVEMTAVLGIISGLPLQQQQTPHSPAAAAAARLAPSPSPSSQPQARSSPLDEGLMCRASVAATAADSQTSTDGGSWGDDGHSDSGEHSSEQRCAVLQPMPASSTCTSLPACLPACQLAHPPRLHLPLVFLLASASQPPSNLPAFILPCLPS